MAKRKFDEIKNDLVYEGSDEILTDTRYYAEQKAKYPDSIILMRYYDTIHVMGDDALTCNRLLSDLLTHKHAGRMYCFDPTNYTQPQFSFGKHNLERVIRELIRQEVKTIVCNYDKAFEEWGGHERVSKMIERSKALREQQKRKLHPRWVQASMFDVPGFLG